MVSLFPSLPSNQVSFYPHDSVWYIKEYYTDASASPINVTAIVVNSTVISVQWDGLTPCRYVNGRIVKYRVQYTSESSGVIESKDELGGWDDRGIETLLTGLTPYTNYTISVAAVNVKEHVGLYSNPITNQTTEYCKCFAIED